jgi:citrate synthase
VLCGAAEAPTIAQALAQHWQVASAAETRLLDACLILAADHELNVSSFTARCVASTGATPYAAIAAALAALQGPRHGGQTLRCETFLREAEGDGRRAVLNRLKLGEPIPGFGHRLYPEGDPRGRYLVETALALAPDMPEARLLREVRDATAQALGLQPTLDFGLVAAARMLGLPAGTPLLLFALGRLAGWIGHILEQYAAGALIRPRARYTGPLPEPATPV